MHLYLIGYRGSGKSTVSRHLGRALSMPSVDTDDLIEAASKHSIREIFESEGESGFRDREEAVVADVAKCATPTVVATGGGVVLRKVNRERMSASGHCVWLNGSAETLFKRIDADDTSNARRPNLSSRGGFAEIVEVLTTRLPLYRDLAQTVVETDDKSADEVVEEILNWLRTQGPHL